MELRTRLQQAHDFLNQKYYELEDFTECLMLSLISKTNMIALGQPGIAKSAVLRELVAMLDFSDVEGTPYFQIQMGADISPNNIFGAPDIDYFKTHGIIKRHVTGFLPDAIIAFCSEFYRVSDQVANSGLLTILNEGEYKNGVDVIPTKLRFFMADTNFFPKQSDDLDVEEEDIRLQALHDRFLARVLVKPLQDPDNQVKMFLMDDGFHFPDKISLKELITLQDNLESIEIPVPIARDVITIAQHLRDKHGIFLSPRRVKLSRNLMRASAWLHGRDTVNQDDLRALRFSFWQREEDIRRVEDAIDDQRNKPLLDAKLFHKMHLSVLQEFERTKENQSHLPGYEELPLIKQVQKDLFRILEHIQENYPHYKTIPAIHQVYQEVEKDYAVYFDREIQEKWAFGILVIKHIFGKKIRKKTSNDALTAEEKSNNSFIAIPSR